MPAPRPHLILPFNEKLPPAVLTNESAFLADGSLVVFSIHDATAFWGGQTKRVYAHLFRHHAPSAPWVCGCWIATT